MAGTVIRFVILMLFVAPALPIRAAAPHSGLVGERGFTVSDLALFAFAVLGVWLARRGIRRRMARKRD